MARQRPCEQPAGAGGVARRQEHDRQRVEEVGLALTARLRQPTASGTTLEALEDLVNAGPRGAAAATSRSPARRSRDRVGVSRRSALADEKADVPDDAVADLAESREMDEQPLLEQRRQRAVQVRRLANFQSSSASPGAASAEQKKLGRTPKRSVTSRLKRSMCVCSCADSLIT